MHSTVVREVNTPRIGNCEILWDFMWLYVVHIDIYLYIDIETESELKVNLGLARNLEQVSSQPSQYFVVSF